MLFSQRPYRELPGASPAAVAIGGGRCNGWCPSLPSPSLSVVVGGTPAAAVIVVVVIMGGAPTALVVGGGAPTVGAVIICSG